MTYTDQQEKQRISLGNAGNAVMMLIAICLIMFVGLAFMKAVWYFKFNNDKDLALSLFNKNILGIFTLPADGNKLLVKPWTIITHMFVHDNVWRVFSNMLWLWSFGYILQDLNGNKKIAPVFIYGSLGGAIAFLLAYNLFPSLTSVNTYAVTFGASAGVMAVAVVTTLLSPGYRLFPQINGGIPLWILTTLYFVSDLLTISISDTVSIITHLAGAFTGILFILFLRKGNDGSKWMSKFFHWVNNLFNPHKPGMENNFNSRLFNKPDNMPLHQPPGLTQQRIDDILDKINQKGYHSLNDEEKDLLKRAGEEYL